MCQSDLKKYCFKKHFQIEIYHYGKIANAWTEPNRC